MEVEKEINTVKKELHSSIDVASRVLDARGCMIGFVYLKSMTSNDIFSEAIFEPISSFDGEIDYEKVKNLIQANDIAFVQKK